MFVSLGSHSLAILNTRAKHTRLELYNPESLEGGIGVTGRRPGSGLNPPKRGDVAPKPPASGGEGTLALQGGEEVSSQTP